MAALLSAGVAAQASGALQLYADEARGVRRPVSARRPVMTPELRRLHAALRELAQDDAAAAVAVSVAGSEVDTAQAARMLSVTPRRVLQMLADGSLRGRPVGRIWLVDTDSINRRSA